MANMKRISMYVNNKNQQKHLRTQCKILIKIKNLSVPSGLVSTKHPL